MLGCQERKIVHTKWLGTNFERHDCSERETQQYADSLAQIDSDSLSIGPVRARRVHRCAAKISEGSGPEFQVVIAGGRARALSTSAGRMGGCHREGGNPGWKPLVARQESPAQ